MKQIISFLFLIQLVVFSAFSQNTEKYIESIREVQEYLLDNEYSEALFILKDLEFNGNTNANMEYLMGICYLYSIADKPLSIQYLKGVTGKISNNYNSSDPSETRVPAETYLYLGDAYLVNNRIKEARQSYLRYINLPYISESQKDIGRSRIKNCLFARLQTDNPLPLQLENAGNIINSGIANAHACLSADGKKMVFIRTLKFYDGVYYSYKTDSGWVEPISITTQVGSDGEFIPTSISPDGTRILFKTFVETYGNELYESVYNGRKWTKVKRFGAPVNSKYHDIDASYAPDGKAIYFSSNRAGGFGGYDIYIATPDSLNNSYVVSNMGDIINSTGDEKSPSIIEKGKILVFSSDDKVSIGGYDYYYSHNMGNNKWSEPLNIGYPLNSTSDDIDMRFSALTPNQGVLARFDPKGYSGTDIFFFNAPVFSTLRLIPLSGKISVRDSSDLASKNLMLAVYDEEAQDTAIILKPNDDGTYFAELYPGKFNLIIKSNDSVDVKQDFTIPSGYSGDNFALQSKLKEPVVIIPQIDTLYVYNILFEFDLATFSEKERIILDKLISQLVKYSIKSIQLIGYTDALGNNQYNKNLSELRANSVKDYFISKGFSTNSITTEGKGSSNFIAKNNLSEGLDNPTGRAINRRVEINLSIDSKTLVIVKNQRLP